MEDKFNIRKLYQCCIYVRNMAYSKRRFDLLYRVKPFYYYWQLTKLDLDSYLKALNIDFELTEEERQACLDGLEDYNSNNSCYIHNCKDCPVDNCDFRGSNTETKELGH